MKNLIQVAVFLALAITMVGCGKNNDPVSKFLGTDKPNLEGDLFAYPSPFSDKTTVRFSSEKSMVVSVKVYTIAGELVRDLGMLNYKAGDVMTGETLWDGRNSDGSEVASGVYIICVSADGKSITFKVARIR